MRAIPLPALLLLALAPAVPAGAASWDRIDATPLPLLRDCPEGFAGVKGSDACVRLGVRLRVEAGAVGAGGPSPLTHVTTTGLGALGSLSVDVRAPTELGPVRAYVRVQSQTGLPGR